MERKVNIKTSSVSVQYLSFDLDLSNLSNRIGRISCCGRINTKLYDYLMELSTIDILVVEQDYSSHYREIISKSFCLPDVRRTNDSIEFFRVQYIILRPLGSYTGTEC